MMKQPSIAKTALIAAILLGGCHAASQGYKGWSDERYLSLMETGEDMVNENKLEAAIPFYKQSLARALEADDPDSVEISAYNLALTQIKNNAISDALKTIKNAQDFLGKHETFKPSRHLLLLKAVALNAQGKWQESQDALALCLKAKDSEIKTHALYIKGLNDSALKSSKELKADIHEIASIPGKNETESENEEELRIREKILHGAYKEAEAEAEKLVIQRRLSHEYSSMRHALALQAEACEHLGNSKKAHDLQLQIIESKKAPVL